MIKNRLLQRSRITAALVAAVENYPLTVITAPMGYGKTTAARELTRNIRHHPFYITINYGLHSAPYIWNQSCEQLLAQGSELAIMLQSTGFPNDLLQARRTLDTGRELLNGRPTLLIIDDYHLAQDARLDAFIEAAVREQIPGLSILLLGRSRPRLPLEELRMKGLAEHFDQDMLRFSEDDAAEFFALHDIDNPQVATDAWNYSEGWAAALWLSLQNYQTAGTIAPVGDMEQLLHSTVFSRYEPEDQTLLLCLSILDSFTPRQAVAVSGDNTAPRRLRLLQEQNALLAYDAGTDRYRLHSIFRTFLGRLLAEQAHPACPAQDLPTLYSRAAEWFAQNGDRFQAVRFFFEAGREEDYLRILQLFESKQDNFALFFDPPYIEKVIKAIPWKVRDRCPIGFLSYVYHCLVHIDLKEGGQMLDEAEQRLKTNASFAEDEYLRLRAQGEIELGKAVLHFNNLDAMCACYRKAEQMLGGRSSILHSRRTWTVGSPHLSFMYLSRSGNYRSLIAPFCEGTELYQKMSGGSCSGAQDLFKAEHLLETGALRQVEPYLMKAAYRAMATSQYSSLTAIRFTQARLLFARGLPEQTEQGVELIDELCAIILQTAHPLLNNCLDLCKGYLASVLDRVDLIPSCMREVNWVNMFTFQQSQVFASVVRAKCLLTMRNWPLLEAVTQDINAQAERYNTVFAHIHSNALTAITMLQTGDREAARQSLRRAIELARPDGILLTLAEYGGHLSHLIRTIQRVEPDDKFLAALYRQSVKYCVETTPGEKRKPKDETRLGLTVRESQILGMAVDGLPNQHIAEALKIRPVTVGNSLTRIYRKLGVQNRMEAAIAWRKSNNDKR